MKAMIALPPTRWKRSTARTKPALTTPPPKEHTEDLAERSAAAIILGEEPDPKGPETFIATDAAGAFVIREVFEFWE